LELQNANFQMQIANCKLRVIESAIDNLQLAFCNLQSFGEGGYFGIGAKKEARLPLGEPGSVGCFESRPTYTSASRHSTQKQVVVA
jgi:hypothetical protein